MNSTNSRRVRSVERAIDAMETLARLDRPLNLGEIARELRAPKSTTLNILRTLVDRRMLDADLEAKTYRLGPALSALTNGLKSTADLAAAARQPLEALAEAAKEVALMAVLDGDETVFIDVVEASQPIKYVAQVGTRRPLYSTSGGKVALAHQPAAEIDKYLARTELRKVTAKTISDRKALKLELARVRKRGYAISYGEHIPDLVGVSAPVFHGPGGQFAGAIVVAGPAFRMRGKLKSVTGALREAAKALTAALHPRMPPRRLASSIAAARSP